jgi:hypothetical protein
MIYIEYASYNPSYLCYLILRSPVSNESYESRMSTLLVLGAVPVQLYLEMYSYLMTMGSHVYKH